jgi:hypothetical protein
LYYNPFQFTSSNDNKSGFVKDQAGNPIKDAIIKFTYTQTPKVTDDHNNVIQELIESTDITFSDNTGFFNCIAKDYLYPYNSGNITSITINSAGTSEYYNNSTNLPTNGSIYNLISTGFGLDKTITGNLTGFNVIENAKNKLNLINVGLINSGVSDFTARTEIDITGNFDSYSSALTDIHLIPSAIDCNVILYPVQRIKSTVVNKEDSNEELVENEFNALNLNFKNKNIHYKIIPNPNNGVFLITNEGIAEPIKISITDLLGNQLFTSNISSHNTELNLSYLSKGIYNIIISTAKSNQVEKLIIK